MRRRIIIAILDCENDLKNDYPSAEIHGGIIASIVGLSHCGSRCRVPAVVRTIRMP